MATKKLWTDKKITQNFGPSMIAVAAAKAMRNEYQLQVDRLQAMLDRIDSCAGKADKTCDEPGIILSEATRRMLIDEGHPAFEGESYAAKEK